MEALVRDRVGKSECGTIALLLILTLAVTVVTLPLRPARAQEEVELYHEDFEDGRAQGWRLEEEGDGEVGWSVRDGELHGSEHFWAVYEPGYWYDARLTLLVQLGNPYLDDRGNGGLHIMMRLSEEGRYVLAISPERVTIFKWSPISMANRPVCRAVWRWWRGSGLRLPPNWSSARSGLVR